MSVLLLGCRDGRAFIRVSGAVGTDTLTRVHTLFRAMDDAGVHRFCVDVTGALAPDLRLVRAMYRADNEARRHGGGVELLGIGPHTVPDCTELTLGEAFAVHAWSRASAPA